MGEYTAEIQRYDPIQFRLSPFLQDIRNQRPQVSRPPRVNWAYPSTFSSSLPETSISRNNTARVRGTNEGRKKSSYRVTTRHLPVSRIIVRSGDFSRGDRRSLRDAKFRKLPTTKRAACSAPIDPRILDDFVNVASTYRRAIAKDGAIGPGEIYRWLA